MITLAGSHANLEGTSGDTKPLNTEENPNNVAVNTVFLELDTGDFYFFDEDGTWKKVGGDDE